MDNKNSIVNTVSNSSEKDELLSQKKLYFSELEMNMEYDERLSFSHFYSVYKQFEGEDQVKEIQPFPFLPIKEFMYSYFEDVRPIREPLKESVSSITGRIQQFSNSHDDRFKKQFLDNIKPYAEKIGIEITGNLLIPALAKIVDDTVSIKTQFLSVLLSFIDFLVANGEEGYSILKNNILNIIDALYHPEMYDMVDDEMKHLLLENFVKITKNLNEKDKKQYIMNMIFNFANNEEKEPSHTEHKILSIKLIGRLANDFGKETVENYLMAQVSSFSDDESTTIKQEILKILPNICEVVSPEIIKTKLYEILKRLSSDLIWNVRKSCVEILAKIIKINKEKCLYNHIASNNKIFVEICEKLTIDNQKYVRFTVLEKIGEIVAQLDKDELSTKLFDFYRNSIEEYYYNIKDRLELDEKAIQRSQTSSNDYFGFGRNLYYYAFNFPAMLYCYGADSWKSLRKIYLNLCKEQDEKIRRSIISSFHEISAILGQELTEKELLPLYDNFLASQIKAERNLAIRNLPKILKVVNKETKEKYFKYFEAVSLFQKNDNKIRNFNFLNWKNKLDVAESILCYYNLYENDVIYDSIIPQCITFCLDDIFKVRAVSGKVLANLIIYLYINNYKKENLIKLIQCFAYNKSFKNRITFIKMCKVFLNCYSIYKEVICNYLKDLTNDKIIDVKISLSKLVSKCISNEKCPCYNDKDIHAICRKLLKTKSKCIQVMLNDVNILPGNEVIEDKVLECKENLQFLVEEFKIDSDE